MENNLKKKKNFLDRLEAICSITVKNEGRALNIIFVLCLICIISLSIFLYRSSTGFYQKLDETMQNNVDFNIEMLENEHQEYIQNLLNNL